MKEDRIETHLSDFFRRMKTPSEASAKYACNGQKKPHWISSAARGRYLNACTTYQDPDIHPVGIRLCRDPENVRTRS